MLSEPGFRHEVLSRVDDPYLLRYWREEFDKMRPQLRGEAVSPVQTRLAYFASSKRAREIVGQRESTFDLRRAIENGDIILINTAQGIAGRDVAALVGASLLNLVDAIIRQQALKPQGERQSVYIVVDEFQSIPGVNFQGMLSEVGKFGGSLCLVTQSLTALDDLSLTLRDVILANISSLVVFQVAAVDAQKLVWELGRDVITEADITSLPVHHCYVRVTVDGTRIPTFSMALRPPQEGDPLRAAAVRANSERYTLTAEEVEEIIADEAYESILEQEDRAATTSSNMEGGASFVDITAPSSRQQGGIERKARQVRRRRSRVHPHNINSGGYNTKPVIGASGKQSGDNLSAPVDPDRTTNQDHYER